MVKNQFFLSILFLGLASSSLVACAKKHQLPMAGVEDLEYTEGEMAEWRREAEDRRSTNPQSARARILQSPGWNGNSWGANETSMRSIVTQNMTRVVDLLDVRYPYAVPNTDRALRQVVQAVEAVEPPSGILFGNQIKAAALRFLNSNYYATGDSSDSAVSGLTFRQLIALVWYATQDNSAFSASSTYQRRVWNLTTTFARIQRAHNDGSYNGAQYIWTSDSPARSTDPTRHREINSVGGINWDDAHHPDNYFNSDPDRNSCAQGTVTRLLETLEGEHSDFPFTLRLTQGDLSGALPSEHATFFRTRDQATREAIERGAERNAAPADAQQFRRYVRDFKDYLRMTLPGVDENLVNQVVTDETVRIFFDIF